MSRRDRDEWGDGPDEEPRPVEWEVSGWTATGKKVSHYIKAVDADEACELLLERYNSEGIMLEDTEACLSPYQ